MAKGIFPQMSTPDIINALAGWGISVSPEQLRTPTSDFVEGVYCACLEQVTGLTHELIRESVQNTLDNSQVDDKVRDLIHSSSYWLMTAVGYLCLSLDKQHCSIPPVSEI